MTSILFIILLIVINQTTMAFLTVEMFFLVFISNDRFVCLLIKKYLALRKERGKEWVVGVA